MQARPVGSDQAPLDALDGRRHSPVATWKIQGGGNTRKIAKGDTIWVVDRLHPQAAANPQATPVWTLVARIEVEKIRPVVYQSHIIHPGPGSRWFPLADLTHVVAQLLRARDDRDMPEPVLPPPEPPPPPPLPPRSPPSIQDKERFFKLFDEPITPAGGAPSRRPPSPPAVPSAEPRTRLNLGAWERGAQRIARLMQEQSQGSPEQSEPQAKVKRKMPPAGPPRAIADTLRYSQNEKYPWVSCLIDAEPLRQWAEHLAATPDAGE